MQFGVLGPVVVSAAQGPVSIGPLRQRTLLAALLVDTGRTVSSTVLAVRIWGEQVTPATASSLHATMSRLRTAVGPGHILTSSPGYRLVAERDAVDALHFADEYGRARRLMAAGSVAAAQQVLTGALELWRADAYADILAPFARQAAANLAEQRLAALGLSADLDLLLGRNHAAAATLVPLVRENSLREDFRAALMLALYRGGRQAEALGVFREGRSLLAGELGIEPGPALQRLHELILRQDPDLAVGGRPASGIASAGPSTGSGSSAVGMLPTPSEASGPVGVPAALTPLIGRRADVRAVQDMLARHRLVTVVGIGGIGKSRLVLEVLRRATADGPVLVELADLSDGSLLIEAIAAALGLSTIGSVDALASTLSGRSVLLVADNCEQIAGTVAEVAVHLLGRCPVLTILATSREVLGVPGEAVYQLQPLASADAHDLFARRAEAASSGFSIAPDDRSLLADICQDLDNLPLAIELAAAQCRAFSLRQLAGLLADRFAVLTGSAHRSRRHATMLAAVQWSYESLAPDEREIFTALSVLEGTFDVAGAHAAIGRPDVAGALRTMIDKSLVLVTGGEDAPMGSGAPGEPRRYRMLETLRQYGARRRDDQATAAIHRRIVARFVALAAGADGGLRGPAERSWVSLLTAETPMLRAALDWSDVDRDDQLRIAAGISWFWYLRGNILAGGRVLRRLLADSHPPVMATTVVRAHIGWALLSYLAGDLPTAVAQLEVAGHKVDDIDGADAQAYALATISYFQAAGGSTSAALQHGEQALAIARSIGSGQRAADALQSIGMAHFRAGRLADADEALSAGVEFARAVGYRWCAGSAGWILTKVRISRGDLSHRAVSELVENITACESQGDITSWIVLVDTLAYVAFRRGDVAAAAELSGITEVRGASIGFSSQAMDPVDLCRYRDEMSVLRDDAVWVAALDRGRRLEAPARSARLQHIVGALMGEIDRVAV